MARHRGRQEIRPVDNMTEEETRAAYNALPWKKAIFVDVHQYEEEPDAEV